MTTRLMQEMQRAQFAADDASAALDAEWREACLHEGNNSKDGWIWCGNCDFPLAAKDPEDKGPFCACAWSAPLRALLAGGTRG